MVSIRSIAATVLLYIVALSATISASPRGLAAHERTTNEQVIARLDGLPHFEQSGRLLTVQPHGGPAIEARLPEHTAIHSVARNGDVLWVSGRVNSPGIDRAFVAEVGDEGDLKPLPAPAAREHPRQFPRFVADGSNVAGLVWREGIHRDDQRLLAAEWTDIGWGEVEVIAADVEAEQTGLVASVLRDGSWLAVWARVDADDDLWWSRRSGTGWSEPRRVHPDNGTPDISPRLVPLATGALLAWSWFDGHDYRLRLAGFERDEWRELGVESGRGSVPAGFVDLPSGPGLLYSFVGPEAHEPYRWALISLNRSGAVLGRLEARAQDLRPPVVIARQEQLLLRWGGDRVKQAAEVDLIAPAGAVR